MSAYRELIKSFDKIRSYLREFYVYGMKSREEFREKSARSYDDERRRLESWLGDYVGFVYAQNGKNGFISIDSRRVTHNPFYRAWKTKSFTDKDITLHFLIFDILWNPFERKTIGEMMRAIDEEYMARVSEPMMFDESTVRKKLKEYEQLGMLVSEKEGRCLYYRRAEEECALPRREVLDYFSEVSPCGVIGSYLLDRLPKQEDILSFKHHYLTGAMDSEVLQMLFEAMRQKKSVSLKNQSRRKSKPSLLSVVPLRILISVQSGRTHLIASPVGSERLISLRVDYLSDVRLGAVAPRFDALRAKLDERQKKMWGVMAESERGSEESGEWVSFTLRIESNEQYILQRLIREKRIGTITQLDERHYHFRALITEASELIPWIRTFLCRITDLHFSNRELEKMFFEDLEQMYRMYGIREDRQVRV